jgi:hypothetical protein
MGEAMQGEVVADAVQARYGFRTNMDREPEDHVQEVLRQANEELRSLVRQRAELVKRIGTVKQTIAGLVNLFGKDAMNAELLELVDEQKPKRAQRGFTRMCRLVLMENHRPMSARDICEQIRGRDAAMISHHRDPVASVTTVLNRLTTYGEAHAVTLQNGRRAWEWVSDDT